ncbi:MAG TPA: ADP-heptose synthase [Bacilli bacterium]
MPRVFVTEAVMFAIYGQLLVPEHPVEYIVPYATIQELYDLRESKEPVMQDEHDETLVREKIAELIGFFEQSFTKKKIERALQAPWKKSPPILINDKVTVSVVNAYDNVRFGDTFDPIETELILVSEQEQMPILTDQYEFIEKIVNAEIPVRVFDIDDFAYALETEK